MIDGGRVWLLATKSHAETSQKQAGNWQVKMTSDFVKLFYMWRHDGLTPLALVKGFAECFLSGGFGDLTDSQQEAMQVIDRRCFEATEGWYKFSDYFYLNSPDKEPRPPAEVGNEGIIFLQEHIFTNSLASLNTITEHLELLLREELGTLADDQREAIEAMSRNCEFAIECWIQPIGYFLNSGHT